MTKYTAMNTRKIPFKLKKIPYQLMLTLLTAGASLILGFLSFSGMYALMPLLPLAFATFILSVAYEGEIYFQNIKGALSKLFKNNYLEQRLAKEYLLTYFPEHTDDAQCPQFFRDYKAQLLLLEEFEHKELTKESKAIKKQIQRTLKDMEHWFSKQLFNTSFSSKTPTPYAKELQLWLVQNHQEEWHQRLKKRATTFNFVKGFSALSALFMSLGSTYLLVEAFSAIPLFAAISFTLWPLIILPMAVIAGAAYGFLTYNAITDLINNNTIIKWYNKLKENWEHDLKHGLTPRTVFMTTSAVFLSSLAIALTVCTAGTWWTIATNARPLFNWMRHMPSAIMGVINPIITGTSAIFFNLQNTAESLEMVDEALRSKQSIIQSVYKSLVDGWNHIKATENWLQIINPFRLVLKLTVTPLRILLFFGHLVSVSLTADRMPGIPQIVAALVAIISEGFEDAHYFIPEDTHTSNPHEHHDFKDLLAARLEGESHHHHDDIPTRLLRIIAAPLYALAAVWDILTSKINDKPSTKRVLSFKEAWNKQRDIDPEEDVILSPTAQYPSQAWQKEHTVYLIEKKITKLANTRVNTNIAQAKITQLNALKGTLQRAPAAMRSILEEEQANPVYNQHRLFAVEQETSTQKFVRTLPERTGLTKVGMWKPSAQASCYGYSAEVEDQSELSCSA